MVSDLPDYWGVSSLKIPEELGLIYHWTQTLTDENPSMGWWRFYTWPKEVRQLLTRIIHMDSCLVFLRGLQGIGKTSALRALYEILKAKSHRVLKAKWSLSPPLREFNKIYRDYDTLLIDLPDYPSRGSRAMNKHLDQIHKIWEENGHCKVFVIALQKELAHGHYFLGKGSAIDLQPVAPETMIGAYLNVYRVWNPFTPEALTALARLSGGIFRRFKQYMGLCIEEAAATETNAYDVDLVNRTITEDILLNDMEAELGITFPHPDTRKTASRIVLHLRREGAMNQKTLAEQLELAESTVTRAVKKLDGTHIQRTRGKGKEYVLHPI